MNVFSCKLRLNGSVLNEVPKINVSAPEIIVLRSIHGPDSVVDMKLTGNPNREHLAERDRLSDIYGHDRIVELFGPEHRELPLHVAGYTESAPTVENMDVGDESLLG